jgi:hypothetical protein
MYHQNGEENAGLMNTVLSSLKCIKPGATLAYDPFPRI